MRTGQRGERGVDGDGPARRLVAMARIDRFLDDRDRDFVWHPHRGSAKPATTNPDVWAMFPLDAGAEGEDRWSDVTFRLGLIARLMGRPIEVV